MNELDEFSAVRGPEPRRRRDSNPWPIVILVLVALAAIGAYFWWQSRPQPEPETQPAVAAPEPAPAAAPEPDVPIPPLASSDSAVRILVARITAHPQVGVWLANDDLVRRFVVSVTNVAEGVSPRRHLAFLTPDGAFDAASSGQRLEVDAASYRRYDLLADVVASVDARGFADLFARLELLMQEAYRELGYPDADFRRTFLRALRRLLRTPVPDGPVELEADVATYRYADADLEGLSAAQKQLLRMGPENQRKVQAKLGEIGRAMGFAEADLR